MNALQLSSATFAFCASLAYADSTQPNILILISDDHSVNALGTCEKDTMVPLPNLHRLAQEGMTFDRSYCANSISGPSRACILTGRHSHKNAFLSNEGGDALDGSQPTWPKMLQKVGYQTAYIGKWHLVSNPTGFDWWEILPAQGEYWNSGFITEGADGKALTKRSKGYVTDLITQKTLTWLDGRDKDKPFALIVGHKAPHRNWIPATRHLKQIKTLVTQLTPPATLMDDYKNRPEFLALNEQNITTFFCNWNDAHLVKGEIPFEVMKDIASKKTLQQMIASGMFKGQIPADFDMAKHEPRFPATLALGTDILKLNANEESDIYDEHYTQRTREFVAAMKAGKIQTLEDMTVQRWRWYMEDYLGTLLAMDESIGSILDYLDKEDLTENTLVIYAADQSFYLGEHGLYDKRWIFEESLRMPLIMRYPNKIAAGVRSQGLVQNIDYAPTFCKLAGADSEDNMKTFDGRTLEPLFKTGTDESFTNRALYYCFYENPGEHNAPRHDGVRTDRYTFSRIWSLMPNEDPKARKVENEWMLIDNEKDPQQMKNVISDPAYAETVKELREIYAQKREQYEVPANSPGAGESIRFKASW